MVSKVALKVPQSPKKLSILIPAFNQAKLLQATLRNLEQNLNSEMLHGAQNCIEILVSDNASSDETSRVAQSHGSLIRYIRQEENLGFLGNIDFLAKEALGDFIWFLGCGETVSSTNFLGSLVQVLDPLTVRNVVLRSSSSLLGSSKDIEFVESDQNLPGSPLFSESISGNIFNRHLYLKAMGASLVHDSWWPHVERALLLLQDPALVGYRTLTTAGAPLNIGISDSGWAFEGNSFLAPARELELLYRVTVLSPAFRSKRRSLGWFYLPLWILNQKVDNRFRLSRSDFRQLFELLSGAPITMRYFVITVTMFPGLLMRPLARGVRLVRLILGKCGNSKGAVDSG